MDRTMLLGALTRYRTQQRRLDVELPTIDRMTSFVKSEPQCFLRSLKKGHITGSAWLLSANKEACLLTHHRKLGIWIQPGGHADGQSDILQVALTEAQEESGINGIAALDSEVFDVDIHEIPARPKEPAHLHYDVRFLLIAPPGAQYKVSEESHDLAWVSRDQILSYSHEASVLRMAEKWF